MSNAISRFEDFWREMPMSNDGTSVLAHPQDEADLTGRDRQCMQLDLLPLPVNGNLRIADVVILMLNPGFGELDAHWGTPASRLERLAGERANLHQTRWTSDYPMFDLNPVLAGSGGAKYWAGPLGPMKGKLGHLARALANAENDDPAEIRKELSNRIAVVQLVAYRSTAFKDLQSGQKKAGPPQHRLQSSNEALLLAHGLAKEQRKLVVVPYGTQHWRFPTQVTKRLIVYRHGLRQAHFTSKSPGHHLIVETLRTRDSLKQNV